jgi:hypothetical protein
LPPQVRESASWPSNLTHLAFDLILAEVGLALRRKFTG